MRIKAKYQHRFMSKEPIGIVVCKATEYKDWKRCFGALNNDWCVLLGTLTTIVGDDEMELL